MVKITNENKTFLVICKECKKSLKRISNTHLKKCCGMSMEDYSKKYKLDKKELLWMPEREYHSNKMIGSGNSTFGIERTQEWRDKIGNRKLGKKNPKLSQTRLKLKEERGYLQSEEARVKQGNSLKKKFEEDKEWSIKRKLEISNMFKEKWKEEGYKSEHLKKILRRNTPNKPEKIMINLIEKNSLPFNYVGNGKIWFRGGHQSFNPDFLSKNPKHIIEVYGDYWHNLPNIRKRDKERLRTYSKYGYKTLIIWEHELKNPFDVLNKIKEFIK